MKKNLKQILIVVAVVCMISAYYAYSFMFGERRYSAQGPDRAAVSDLRNARTCAEAYYTDNKRYPDSLEEMRRTPGVCQGMPDPDVSLAYERTGRESYTITASHREGKKAFLFRSDDPAIYWRDKDDPDAAWKALSPGPGGREQF